MLHSKFQEKVIILQCLIYPFCTGFQKWAKLEHWHERFAGLMLHFPVSWYIGGQTLSILFSELVPCAQLTFWVTPYNTQKLFQKPAPPDRNSNCLQCLEMDRDVFKQLNLHKPLFSLLAFPHVISATSKVLHTLSPNEISSPKSFLRQSD